MSRLVLLLLLGFLLTVGVEGRRKNGRNQDRGRPPPPVNKEVLDVLMTLKDQLRNDSSCEDENTCAKNVKETMDNNFETVSETSFKCVEECFAEYDSISAVETDAVYDCLVLCRENVTTTCMSTINDVVTIDDSVTEALCQMYDCREEMMHHHHGSRGRHRRSPRRRGSRLGGPPRTVAPSDMDQLKNVAHKGILKSCNCVVDAAIITCFKD